MVNWDRKHRGRNREPEHATSYGDGDSESDYDGKSCSDYHQLPGRGVEDVESLTMLHGLGLNAMEDEES